MLNTDVKTKKARKLNQLNIGVAGLNINIIVNPVIWNIANVIVMRVGRSMLDNKIENVK